MPGTNQGTPERERAGKEEQDPDRGYDHASRCQWMSRRVGPTWPEDLAEADDSDERGLRHHPRLHHDRRGSAPRATPRCLPLIVRVSRLVPFVMLERGGVSSATRRAISVGTWRRARPTARANCARDGYPPRRTTASFTRTSGRHRSPSLANSVRTGSRAATSPGSVVGSNLSTGRPRRFEPIEAFLERFKAAIVNHADCADDRRRDVTEDGDKRHCGLQINAPRWRCVLLIGPR